MKHVEKKGLHIHPASSIILELVDQPHMHKLDDSDSHNVYILKLMYVAQSVFLCHVVTCTVMSLHRLPSRQLRSIRLKVTIVSPDSPPALCQRTDHLRCD